MSTNNSLFQNVLLAAILAGLFFFWIKRSEIGRYQIISAQSTTTWMGPEGKNIAENTVFKIDTATGKAWKWNSVFYGPAALKVLGKTEVAESYWLELKDHLGGNEH